MKEQFKLKFRITVHLHIFTHGYSLIGYPSLAVGRRIAASRARSGRSPCRAGRPRPPRSRTARSRAGSRPPTRGPDAGATRTPQSSLRHLIKNTSVTQIQTRHRTTSGFNRFPVENDIYSNIYSQIFEKIKNREFVITFDINNSQLNIEIYLKFYDHGIKSMSYEYFSDITWTIQDGIKDL